MSTSCSGNLRGLVSGNAKFVIVAIFASLPNSSSCFPRLPQNSLAFSHQSHHSRYPLGLGWHRFPTDSAILKSCHRPLGHSAIFPQVGQGWGLAHKTVVGLNFHPPSSLFATKDNKKDDCRISSPFNCATAAPTTPLPLRNSHVFAQTRQIHSSEGSLKARSSLALNASPSDSSEEILPPSDSDEKITPSVKQDFQNIVTLIGAQALLLPISAVLANFLNLPNRGLGADFNLSTNSLVLGLQWTVPLFVIAGIMRLIEPYSPALQNVTKATQRSVLAIMGPRRRVVFAVLVSILLGIAAGWGEEWLFRGVFQTILSQKWGDGIALAISGLVFGVLHAVTPVYAILAGAASVFFGYLYSSTQNLAVPMVCHAVYDIGALIWAHISVTALSSKEQDEILDFGGPGAPILKTKNTFD